MISSQTGHKKFIFLESLKNIPCAEKIFYDSNRMKM